MSLPLLFIAGVMALQGINIALEKRMTQQVLLPSFDGQVLNGSKVALKSVVDAEALALANTLKARKSRDEKIATVVTETDPIRFFDDGSGYFFTYDLKGVRINVPINKSQNGQNCLALQDKKGIRFVEQFIKAARNGGGFVEYYFEKEGKGIQPKLSYVRTIPDTDFIIGAGVYIDNVEAERNLLQGKIAQANSRLLIYKIAALAAIFSVLVAVSLWVARGISRPIMEAVDSLSHGSQQVASASEQIAQSSQKLATGASDQVATLQESSSAIEELASQAKGNAEKAVLATQGADQARTQAEQVNSAMDRTVSLMTDIKDSAGKIRGIIKTIEGIAFQTNLLALNAAVEAARAGEHGKGFAVVAGEVRNLALRSAQAAKDTAILIQTSVDQSNRGATIITEVAESFKGIVEIIRTVADNTKDVTAASNEQSQGVGRINGGIVEIEKTTQEVAASAEESASASEELSAQAQQMQSVVTDLAGLVQGTRSTATAHKA